MTGAVSFFIFSDRNKYQCQRQCTVEIRNIWSDEFYDYVYHVKQLIVTFAGFTLTRRVCEDSVDTLRTTFHITCSAWTNGN